MDKKVTIIGLGYVGLPLAVLAAERGYDVIGIDIDESKLTKIQNREVPFIDETLVSTLKNVSITATSDFSLITQAETVVICVPTPVDANKNPDYNFVISSCTSIAPYVQENTLIILESTVNPGVCDELVIPLLENKTGLTVGRDLFVAHCPERINPGDTQWNVSNIPRVVGGNDAKSLERALEFYTSIIDAKILKMKSLKEAEAVKVVENSFRNINIAFVNELAKSFDKMGIDVVNVLNGCASKPFSFMAHYPGCGVGGHCIPVDPHYLIQYAKNNYGFSHELLKTACQTNDSMPEYTVLLLKNALQTKGKTLQGTNVALLGLSYKPNVGDDRESPAYDILTILDNEGAIVTTYDPYIQNKRTGRTLHEVLQKVEAVLLATDHTEFITISPDSLSNTHVEIIIDGRNCLDKHSFDNSSIYYKGIGR